MPSRSRLLPRRPHCDQAVPERIPSTSAGRCCGGRAILRERTPWPQLVSGQRREHASATRSARAGRPAARRSSALNNLLGQCQRLCAILLVAHVSQIPSRTIQRTGEFLWPTSCRALARRSRQSPARRPRRPGCRSPASVRRRPCRPLRQQLHDQQPPAVHAGVLHRGRPRDRRRRPSCMARSRFVSCN